MTTAIKLPFTFDTVALKSDLEKIEPHEWVNHFNQLYYEGRWSGVALRSVNGAATQLYLDPTMSKSYAGTPVLDRCGYFKEVLGTFKCSLESARLLKLDAGSRINEHRDFDLGFRYGVVRVHVPIQTSSDIEFFLNDERVVMDEGESWYLNLSLPHRVYNRGTTDRIHLVIDCVVNEWVKSLIEF
ncbi:MAG: aspartyl/asparaginyl beta-hydroxylase domain-containing protein [Pyrinomonadaceae bacterium]|nr:aspartyl/asparaginyl beta-hydroxylase domain-containing protein [Pyrinomonadaceae bacterium]